MSLELAIQKNTEAILALTAALSTQTAPKADVCCTEKKPKKTVVADAAPEPVSVTVVSPEPDPVSVTVTETPAAASPMPTLAELQAEGKKLLDACKQAELKSIVLANGGTKLSLLPESGYRATLKALKAAVAAL